MQAVLQFRPLQETISSILKWDISRNQTKLKTGLDPKKEKMLLAKWAVDPVN